MTATVSGTAYVVLLQALDRIEAGAGLASFPAYEHECLLDALQVFGDLYDVAKAVVDGTASTAELDAALCNCTDLFEARRS